MIGYIKQGLAKLRNWPLLKEFSQLKADCDKYLDAAVKEAETPEKSLQLRNIEAMLSRAFELVESYQKKVSLFEKQSRLRKYSLNDYIESEELSRSEHSERKRDVKAEEKRIERRVLPASAFTHTSKGDTTHQIRQAFFQGEGRLGRPPESPFSLHSPAPQTRTRSHTL